MLSTGQQKMSLGADIQGSAPNACGIAHLQSGDPLLSQIALFLPSLM
jgi:hypothetical protein